MAWLTDFLQKLADALGHVETEPVIAPVAPNLPPTAPLPVVPPSMPTYDFSTPQKAFHSTRVICDEEGLKLGEKNLICACIYQESTFKNSATCKNKDKQGNVWSTDWGICQVNDWFHCGKGKEFPSAQYVVDNPEKCVRWMIKMYHLGQLHQWVSYSSEAYKVWLRPNSKMWALKS